MATEWPKVALVTGAASGIGKATVSILLEHGWSVVGMDLNTDTGKRLVGEVGAEYRECFRFVAGDVSREADVEAAVAFAVETFGHLDGLVNNAAITGAFGPVTELDVEDWDATFAVITRGVFLGIKHGAREMKSSGGGSIVNVASIAASVGDAGPQAYSAAKAGVAHMTRVFATELGPDGIRINAVSPGPIATPMNPVMLAGGLSPELRRMQPLPLAGQPEHLGNVIAFLLSSEAEYVTGQDVAVDGGLLAAGPRLGEFLGSDPRKVRAVGLMNGNTGVKTVVRSKLAPSPQSHVTQTEEQ